MIMWLDHRIFGNGHGIRSPYWDNVFYWLSGELYTFFPGHGAQLTSWQWTRPPAGERRTLAGREYVIWRADRRWGRVVCKWALARLPADLDQANALLRLIETELGGTTLARKTSQIGEAG
jgi:hypothetical protein